MTSLCTLDLREQHKKHFVAYYKHLPDEFFPLDVMNGPDDVPKDQWTRAAWSKFLCKTFPRSHIPTKLHLKSGISFQPPRFLFGWALELSTLQIIGERCGFAKYLRPLDFQDLCESLTSILRNRFPQTMDQLGCVFIGRVAVHDKKPFYCIALADSWITGNRKPTANQTKDLREFFGIGDGDTATLANGEPMWWMELISQQWHYRHKWEDLRDYRPWDLRRTQPN